MYLIKKIEEEMEMAEKYFKDCKYDKSIAKSLLVLNKILLNHQR